LPSFPLPLPILFLCAFFFILFRAALNIKVNFTKALHRVVNFDVPTFPSSSWLICLISSQLINLCTSSCGLGYKSMDREFYGWR
ncbi:hypothetical protein L9F63_018227, partial [Diploptera punctata]